MSECTCGGTHAKSVDDEIVESEDVEIAAGLDEPVEGGKEDELIKDMEATLANLKEVLFEPIDEITTARIEREVRSAIDSWEKRAEVLNVFVDPDEDYNRYKVSVTFRPINSVVEELVEVYLKRER